MDTDIERSTSGKDQDHELNSFDSHDTEGRPSVIHGYCEDSIKGGSLRCIWVCMKSRNRWIAKDIPIMEDEFQTIGVYKLREIRGWWKRHSLYSATGVKEVKIHFIEFDKANNEIGVAIAELSYERLGKELDESIAASLPDESFTCGVGSMGQSHSWDENCPNERWDGEITYCSAQYSRRLRIRRDNYEYLPSILDYYWQKGITKDGLEFLETSGFITTYKYYLLKPIRYLHSG